MSHLNAMGQPCDGTPCALCTQCSNCKHRKPGEYKRHEHDFRPVADVRVRAATI